MKRAVNRIALYGFLGSGNLGNDASLETVAFWFQDNHPTVDLHCITIAPEEVEARYGITSMPLAWSPSTLGRRRKAGPLARAVGRLLDIPRSFRLAGSVDAVIVPGMGVLEDTLGVRPWGLPYWLFLMSLACRLRHRPFLFLAVGADRGRNPVTGWLYRSAVRLAAHASYRDEPSGEAMRRPDSDEPPTITPDLAFAHPAPAQPQPEPGRVVVGVMAYYGPRHDPAEGADLYRSYVGSMTETLVRVARAGRRLLLVGGDEADMVAAYDIRAAVLDAAPELAADVEVSEAATFAELTREMTRAEIVVASRFHNLICALRLARPTVSVGYAGKNRELMRAFDMADYTQEIDGLDPDRLVAQIRTAQDHVADLSAHIHGTATRNRDAVEALLRRISKEELGLETLPRGRTIADEGALWPVQ